MLLLNAKLDAVSERKERLERELQDCKDSLAHLQGALVNGQAQNDDKKQ